MKTFVALMLTALTGTALASDASLQFLISSAAHDFHAHGLPDVQVREVHFGHRPVADGQNQYVLCGKFRAAHENEWQYFATIQTSHYEQWLGAQAASLCEGREIQWGGRKDLSAELQHQLEVETRQL